MRFGFVVPYATAREFAELAALGETRGWDAVFTWEAVWGEKLDECLAIYDGLLRGQPFGYAGKHYRAKPTDHLVPAPPAQRPRPPVWAVGARVMGRADQPSLRRAARWDGLLPAVIENGDGRDLTGPDELAAVVAEVQALRAAAGRAAEPYDVVIEADSTGEFVQLDPPEPAAWAAAGATWWIESWWTIEPGPEGLAEVRRRIEAGPPARVTHE
jgi:alkanesulfonate monooxygenase SsuD/methylene tetrahydromethanopterin reductase-like flavin-dependent oxidoreductase (luciferase family)